MAPLAGVIARRFGYKGELSLPVLAAAGAFGSSATQIDTFWLFGGAVDLANRAGLPGNHSNRTHTCWAGGKRRHPHQYRSNLQRVGLDLRMFIAAPDSSATHESTQQWELLAPLPRHGIAVNGAAGRVHLLEWCRPEGRGGSSRKLMAPSESRFSSARISPWACWRNSFMGPRPDRDFQLLH